jgi:hypothetical protein
MGAREPGGGFPVEVYERGSWYPQPTVGPCTGLGIGWPIQLLAMNRYLTPIALKNPAMSGFLALMNISPGGKI